MKYLFFTILFFVSINCFGQTLQVGESYRDSISVLKSCKWQLSAAKYTDMDGKKYQVFLDIDSNEVFMIFRKEQMFVKIYFK